MLGHAAELAQDEERVLQVVQDPEQEDEPVALAREPATAVEVEVLDPDPGPEVVPERPRPAEAVLVGGGAVDEVDLPAPLVLEEEGEVPVGPADVRDRQAGRQPPEIPVLPVEERIEVPEVRQDVVPVPDEIGADLLAGTASRTRRGRARAAPRCPPPESSARPTPPGPALRCRRARRGAYSRERRPVSQLPRRPRRLLLVALPAAGILV